MKSQKKSRDSQGESAEESDLELQEYVKEFASAWCNQCYKVEVESFVPRAMRGAAYLRW